MAQGSPGDPHPTTQGADAHPASALRRRLKLPEAKGVRGHLEYTWAALKVISDFRRQVALYDQRLKESVARRDRALEVLGAHALKLAEHNKPERVWEGIIPFQDTIKALEVEHSDITQRSALMHIALRSTENEGKRAIEEIQQRRNALREERAPHQGDASDNRQKVQALEAELKERLRDHQRLKEQIQLLQEDLDAGGGQDLLKDIRKLEAEVGEADTRIAQIEAERGAVESQRDASQERADALLEQIKALEEEEKNRRLQLETRLAELKATMQESTRKAERLDERRKAVHIDLARELVRLPKPASNLKAETAQAQLAMSTCDNITAARSRIQVEWDRLDTAPIRVTATWIVICVFALILLAVLW